MKQYSFTINGKPYEVRIDAVQDGEAEVIVNGTRYRVEVPETPAAEPVRKSPVIPRPGVRHRPLPVRGGTAVESPMPGIGDSTAVPPRTGSGRWRTPGRWTAGLLRTGSAAGVSGISTR
jgi:hypothetical protein